jgi:hypothetical protein
MYIYEKLSPISDRMPYVCEVSAMMESTCTTKGASPGKRVKLLSKELEEATNLFLLKMAELEKLLPLIEE